ncbi:hypothetical protein XH92_40435 [Bradyrhizobium sp. CCBAU 53421]|nr:hypothetical protein XH92_40435 [Bradyrhizobium sp. CCBAU 53421]
MRSGEVSTPVGLPPPLRGRVGERGKPQALTSKIERRHINEHCNAVTRRVAIRHTAEQAAPLSLPLPRKGGGNERAEAASLANRERSFT